MTEDKIVYFGATELSANVLQTLYEEGFNIVAVITQPDRKVGRKQVLAPTPVASKAQELGIATIKPEKLNSPAFQQTVTDLQAELFVVFAYGKIIPKNILSLAKSGALNIHPSLLPQYRGPAPIRQALLDGQKKTGVTIMLMDEEMDHGPILLQENVFIDSTDTLPELEAKLQKLSQELITLAIPKYISGLLTPTEQNHNLATFTKIVEKSEGRINWQESAEQIYNKFRAYINWPGIYTNWQGKTVKIIDCAITNETTTKEAGTIIAENDKAFVQCGTNQLELITIQLEGKKPTQIKDFLRGYREFANSKLE